MVLAFFGFKIGGFLIQLLAGIAFFLLILFVHHNIMLNLFFFLPLETVPLT